MREGVPGSPEMKAGGPVSLIMRLEGPGSLDLGGGLSSLDMRNRGDPGSLDLRGVWFLVHEGGIPGSPEMTLRGGLFFDMRGVPGSLDMQEMVLGFLDMRSGLLVPLT